jgi:hypothetical protein
MADKYRCPGTSGLTSSNQLKPVSPMDSTVNGKIGKRYLNGKKSKLISPLVMLKMKYTFQTTLSQYENIVVK